MGLVLALLVVAAAFAIMMWLRSWPTFARILLALTWATIPLGIFGLLRTVLFGTDLLRPLDAFTTCLPAAAAALGVLFAAALSRRETRQRAVFLELAIVGAFGLPGAAFALGRELDIAFDFGPRTEVHVPDTKVESVVTRRKGNHGQDRIVRWLDVPAWPAGLQGPSRIRLGRSARDFHQWRTDAVIEVGQGALGFAWIASVRDDGPMRPVNLAPASEPSGSTEATEQGRRSE